MVVSFVGVVGQREASGYDVTGLIRWFHGEGGPVQRTAWGFLMTAIYVDGVVGRWKRFSFSQVSVLGGCVG